MDRCKSLKSSFLVNMVFIYVVIGCDDVLLIPL